MTAWYLLAAVALLVVNGFFVAVEFAMVASRRTKIEPLAAQGRLRARWARDALSGLSTQLTACQIGITMASLGLGAVAEPVVSRGLEHALEPIGLPEDLVVAIGFGIALAIVVFLHLVVGEMAPKYMALAVPETVLLWLVVPLRGFTAVFRPVVWLLSRLANAGTRLLGIEPAEELTSSHTSDELAVMLAASRREGLIAEAAHDLLSGALDFGDKVVASVMVPRGKVVTVARTATVEHAEQVVVASGHSRLPVTGRDLDDIVGFIHAKDLLTVPAGSRNRPLPPSRLHRMLKVPANRPLDQVMLEMRRSRIHLAVVEDEDLRMAGIVTLEDVIENLVGDIVDETDRGRLRRLSPRRRPAPQT